MWRLKYIYKIQKGRHHSDLRTSTVIDFSVQKYNYNFACFVVVIFWKMKRAGMSENRTLQRLHLSDLLWNAWCSICVFLHTKEWTSSSRFACSISGNIYCVGCISHWEVLAVATKIIVHWFINILLFLTPSFSICQSF